MSSLNHTKPISPEDVKPNQKDLDEKLLEKIIVKINEKLLDHNNYIDFCLLLNEIQISFENGDVYDYLYEIRNRYVSTGWNIKFEFSKYGVEVLRIYFSNRKDK